MPPFVEELAEALLAVDGVTAVVLGGSRARGTATPASDVDLGVYYRAAHPPDLEQLEALARTWDDDHRPNLITPLGGWGPNINGGGWLTIQGLAVDILYREIERVTTAIEDCRAGRLWFEYQPGHPHGFGPHIYLGEVALCQPLGDPEGALTSLKSLVHPYPPALSRALVDRFWWEAEFSLRIARKSVARADVAYAAGCCFRAVACLLQTLFALNEQYWMNEKGALALAATFRRAPDRLAPRVEELFGLLAADRDAMNAALEILAALLQDTAALLAAQAEALAVDPDDEEGVESGEG